MICMYTFIKINNIPGKIIVINSMAVTYIASKFMLLAYSGDRFTTISYWLSNLFIVYI